MTLLSMGSFLQLICHEHEYTIKGTTVLMLKKKKLGSVQWLKIRIGTTVALKKNG